MREFIQAIQKIVINYSSLIDLILMGNSAMIIYTACSYFWSLKKHSESDNDAISAIEMTKAKDKAKILFQLSIGSILVSGTLMIIRKVRIG
jgi:hypothetical protein